MSRLTCGRDSRFGETEREEGRMSWESEKDRKIEGLSNIQNDVR